MFHKKINESIICIYVFFKMLKYLHLLFLPITVQNVYFFFFVYGSLADNFYKIYFVYSWMITLNVLGKNKQITKCKKIRTNNVPVQI